MLLAELAPAVPPGPVPGSGLAPQARRARPRPATAAVRVVILTTFDLDESVYGAPRAGGSGFLLKDSRPPIPSPPSG